MLDVELKENTIMKNKNYIESTKNGFVIKNASGEVISEYDEFEMWDKLSALNRDIDKLNTHI